MEYYSKSVAPWCPTSCSCTFYHFARVQGPVPPAYTGETFAYQTSQFLNMLTPKLIYARLVPKRGELFSLSKYHGLLSFFLYKFFRFCLKYKKKETVANIKSENRFICICSVTVLVNCSGQGLTSFPRVTKPKLYFLARIQFISLAKLNHISIPSKMALFLSSIYLKVPPHTTILDLSQNNLSEVISQFANSQLTAGQIAVHCATITKR